MERRTQGVYIGMNLLREYEDTGLTPQEIMGKVEALKIYQEEGLTPDQIRELKELDTAKAAIITGYNRAIGCKVGERPKCGAMTRDYLAFCSECGQRLKWEERL